MARVKVPALESVLFEHQYEVSIGDINYGGHMGNERFLLVAQETRLRWFKSLGYESELSIEQLGIIMADAAISYKAEVFHQDQLIIQLGVGERSTYGFDLIYQIHRKADHTEVARVKTAILFFDYKARQLVEPPALFLTKAHLS